MSKTLLLAAFAAVARAACPNSCSGHGTCDANDQCTCYDEGKVLNLEGNIDLLGGMGKKRGEIKAQWTGADCSRMTCPRGISMTQAEYYLTHKKGVECSGAGLCDRATGLCKCNANYEGSACQRTVCPNNCNGHGVCQSNIEFAEDYARAMSTAINEKNLAPRVMIGDTTSGALDVDVASTTLNRRTPTGHLDDYFSTYMVSYGEAWDSGIQFGCKCDDGFTGADCSLAECPTGHDPIDDDCQISEVEHLFPAGTSIAPTTYINLTLTHKSLGQSYVTTSLDGAASIVGDLPKVYGGDASNEHIARAAKLYKSYTFTNTVTYDPKKYIEMHNHFSDLSRRCTMFYISPEDIGNFPMFTNNGAVPSFALLNIDNWLCGAEYVSNVAKVGYCAGSSSSQVCSGRGLCDSATGACTCNAGYSGNACQNVASLS